MNIFQGKSSPRPTVSRKPSSLCRLEIRLDSDYVIFRGRPGEGEAQKLKGRVIIMNSEPLDVKHVTVIAEGKWKTTHLVTKKEYDGGVRPLSLTPNDKGFNLQRSQELSAAATIPAGNNEFPFEIQLQSSLDESFEGYSRDPLCPVHQIYQVAAYAGRKFLHRDLSEVKHFRIIRTIGTNIEEFIDPAGVSGFWADKIKYQWSTASTVAMYGDKVTVDFKLTPLKEKLGIGKIRFWVKETALIHADPCPDDFPGNTRVAGYWWKEESISAEQKMYVPEEVIEDMDEELQMPRKTFSLTFQLEKSLKKCRQTVEYGKHIQTKHSMHISVELLNPEKAPSELLAHSPLRIYISPHLRIQQDLTVTTPSVDFSGISFQGPIMTAPPEYGSHVLDLPVNPFEEIQPSGFVTPAASRSGTTTPGRLGPLTPVTEPANPQSSFSHELLQRLETLQNEAEGQAGSNQNGHVEITEEGYMHIEYDMEELSRAPSYETAMNNLGPVSYGHGPPTYAASASGRNPPGSDAAVSEHA